ncbi:MAG: hypothetical protein HZY76_11355 [Anaerolineae bacterium]|nr:MAG: hypothetical protein HZY76_11355 [Anaerolineae bacterium]
MSLNVTSRQLQTAWQQLRNQWQKTSEGWNDSVRWQFEREFWQPWRVKYRARSRNWSA